MSPPSSRARRAAATALVLAALAPAMVAWWATLRSTAAARLAVLRTVEPYALAVHEQLVRNKALEGAWFQTIHAGYDDAWTWSGHRALTLIGATWLYPLEPSALGMCDLQILATALGTIPAALIGRAVFRDGPLGPTAGLLVGGALYLLSPAAMALALQDYQDLVFALPFLTFTLWTMRAGHRAWPLLGAAVGVMPREECVPLVLACALVTLPPGGRRRHLWNLAAAALVAGTYAGVAQVLHPIETAPGVGDGHDTPLVNALRTVFAARGPQDLPGLAHVEEFYALLWAPVGLLALASPLTLLPGAGLLLMHMTVPYNNGIDHFWSGHAHHVAPLLPFVLVATIEGLGRLVALAGRWRPRGHPVGATLAAVATALLLAHAASWTWTWGTGFHLAWSWRPWTPPYEHPAWTLARRLPAEAVPVVSVRHAVVVSDRRTSYTWEESLHDKARGRGLGAATHLIAPASLAEVTAWALSMDGAQVVDEAEGYVTIAWTPGARDTAGKRREDPWPRVPDWVPEGYTLDNLPGVPRR
ncbi:DUF2079 domain-containing protein [Myxococcota bacterium]|nr:DUF2079 domain-containing protein [Myxococcota bacterium]